MVQALHELQEQQLVTLTTPYLSGPRKRMMVMMMGMIQVMMLSTLMLEFRPLDLKKMMMGMTQLRMLSTMMLGTLPPAQAPKPEEGDDG